MNCPFKDDQNTQQCSKKAAKCFLGIFLTVLVVALGLKVITLILCILPGSCHGNIWLVVIAAIMVLFATKYYKTNHCCHDSSCDDDQNCDDNTQTSTEK